MDDLSVRVRAAQRLAIQQTIRWHSVGRELCFAGDFHSGIGACDGLSDNLEG